MNKKMKVVSITLIIIFFIVGFCYLFKRVNKGVPKEYECEGYVQGETVVLDDFKVTALGIKKSVIDDEFNPGMKRYLYSLELNIKNISSEDKDITDFYGGCTILNENKLFRENAPMELRGIYKGEATERPSIKSQEEKDIILTYNSPNDYTEDTINFYLSKKLYENEVRAKFDKEIMYDKYIEVKID